MSDVHDLLLLVGEDLIQLGDQAVGHGLDLFLGLFKLVLGDDLVFFQFLQAGLSKTPDKRIKTFFVGKDRAVVDLKKLKSECCILLNERIFFVNLYCKKAYKNI